MDSLIEKVAYLKGLCEGLGVDEESSEGKLLKAIIDVLGDIAFEVEDSLVVQDELFERVEEVEDSLDELESEVYDDNFDLDDYDDDDEEWDDEEEYSFTCPECGESIYFDLDMLESDEEYIVCPNCKKKIELEFDCDLGMDCSDCDGCDDDE
jgi:DNA-directed RNA polymerase subunit RPC12/RpoP